MADDRATNDHPAPVADDNPTVESTADSGDGDGRAKVIRDLAGVVAGGLGCELDDATDRVGSFVLRCRGEAGAPDLLPALCLLTRPELCGLFAATAEEQILCLKSAGYWPASNR